MAERAWLVDDGTIVESEFASVIVSVDHQGNGPRLRIQDRRTGDVGYLDPLLLLNLSSAPPERLADVMDPGQGHWA